MREYTDKKENTIFIIYKEVQKGEVAKSYMTNGLLRYDLKVHKHEIFLIFFLT